MSTKKSPIPFLRKVAFIEGISFLVLLGVAMPLKYWAGIPMAVKIVGWAHGILFIAFCGSLLDTMVTAKWPILRSAVVFISSLLPFGPFVVDSHMARWDEEYRASLPQEAR